MLDEFLESNNVDYNSLSKEEQKNLKKVDKEVSQRWLQINDAIEIIANNKININAISKSGVISNKTIYKYNILIQYIKFCEYKSKEVLPGGKETETLLRNKLKDANDIIKKMDIKIIESELYQEEIDKLNEELISESAKNKALADENTKLLQVINDLKSANNDKESILIPMNKK